MNIVQEHQFKNYCIDPAPFHPSKVQTIDSLCKALEKQSKGQTVFWEADHKYYGEGFESWFATAAKLRGHDPRLDLINYCPSGKDEYGIDGFAGCHISPMKLGKVGVQLKNTRTRTHVLDRVNTPNLETPLGAAAVWQLDRVMFVTTGAGVNRKVLDTWNQNRELVRVIDRAALEHMFNNTLDVWETWYQSLLTARVSV